MTRKLSVIMIAIMIAMFVQSNHVAAATISAKVFVADYDKPTGVFYAAVYDSDDHYTPIKFWLQSTNIISSSDVIVTDSNQYLITNTFSLDKPVFTTNHHRFNWSYMDNTDLYTLDGVTDHNGFMDGFISGNEMSHSYAQFSGFVQNGEIAILKHADPNATINAHGWIVQYGNLVRYVAGSTDEDSTPIKHTIMLPVMLH